MTPLISLIHEYPEFSAFCILMLVGATAKRIAGRWGEDDEY